MWNLVTMARTVRRSNKWRCWQISIWDIRNFGIIHFGIQNLYKLSRVFRVTQAWGNSDMSRSLATLRKFVNVLTILNISLDTITVGSIKSPRQDSETPPSVTGFLTSDSSLQSISTAMITILDRAGSNGNSTIWRPRGVRLPVLSSAPKIHSWYMEFKMLSCKWMQWWIFL